MVSVYNLLFDYKLKILKLFWMVTLKSKEKNLEKTDFKRKWILMKKEEILEWSKKGRFEFLFQALFLRK